MSRLRRAVQRYDAASREEEPVLLDSSVQDDVILELKASLARRSKQPSSMFVDAVVAFIVVLNLMLLTVPYYKTGLNGVLSLLTTLCSLLNFVVLKYERFGVEMIGRWRLSLISLVMGAVIVVLKFSTFQVRDMVYVVPLLNCIGLYTMESDDKKLEDEIKSLEKLKYNYKEA